MGDRAFQKYVYGVKLQVISDHNALASVLKPNRRNKTFFSWLRRWPEVDRLLPLEFEITHAPGRVLGLADYLSIHPSEIKGNKVKAEKSWNDWLTVNTITKINAISQEETTSSDLTKSMKLSRAPYSVLRVESKQSERQQSKTARKHEGNQSTIQIAGKKSKRTRTETHCC